jgi:biopolymer transport protein ExbB
MGLFQMLKAFLDTGGVVAWALVGCSVVAVFIFLERILTYHRSQVDGLPNVLGNIIDLLRRRNEAEALVICGQKAPEPGAKPAIQVPALRVVAEAIGNRARPANELREIVEDRCRDEVRKLERNLRGLAAIAHVAPLLGLLGTVLGLLGMFEAMGGESVINRPKDLSGAMLFALLSTGAGCAVSIVSYLLHTLLVSRLESVVHDLEKAGREILNFLTSTPADDRTPAAGTPPSPGTDA